MSGFSRIFLDTAPIIYYADTMGQGEPSPFTAMSEQQILSFLEKSHNQTVCGEIVEAHAALEEIGMQHEFL